jgi:signal-transduction protein with cAMP-binding, CBS, and nucleotidyltransferase domain
MQLVQQIHHSYQKVFAYFDSQRNMSKKKIASIQQSSHQNEQDKFFTKIKDEKYDNLKVFYDYYLFLKDVIYSFHLFFQIVDPEWIRLSPLYW